MPWDRPFMEAIDSILHRRLACGDDTLELFPTDDPAGAVQYVLRHRDVPLKALAADAEDALTLVCGLQAQADHLEHDVIRFARKAGVPWSGIATRLGLRSAQGAEQRFLRLAAERAHGPRDARYGRKERLGELRERQQARSAEGWLKRHEPQILETARAVLAAMNGQPWWSEDAADNAEGMEMVLHDRTPRLDSLMGYLGLLAGEWKNTPGAPDLPAFVGALALDREWNATRPPPK
jgi:hypothetical protein